MGWFDALRAIGNICAQVMRGLFELSRVWRLALDAMLLQAGFVMMLAMPHVVLGQRG